MDNGPLYQGEDHTYANALFELQYNLADAKNLKITWRWRITDIPDLSALSIPSTPSDLGSSWEWVPLPAFQENA